MKIKVSDCRKEVTQHAGLTAICQRHMHKTGPQLASYNLRFGNVLIIPRNVEWLTVFKLFLQAVQFMLNTCFPSQRLEFVYKPDRGCLCDQPRVNTPGAECILSFPGRQYFSIINPSCVLLVNY